ncbi:flavin reductase family protein [Phenylobacterium montanum]|uniref:Flavin reductase family protein n=1 Tax=Phenylobacterium montanum TaxID=2823693 RepID=A0A975G459_9CAUL|nr:flavin reductase family protein [Caulobacter sp. S6]QUD90192.1 flavin reductase family protein [Caulobacter sp. S6]
MKIDSAQFRTVMGHYPTGVSVVTSTTAEGEPIGMTVGTFTSVSLDPPLIGFFPDKRSTSWPKIAATGRFCVNILAQDQELICRKFSGGDRDRFSDVVHRLTANGMPILDGAVAWIDCDLYSVQEAGDHFFVLGEVRAITAERAESPLIFLRGKFGRVIDIEAISA